MSLIQLCFCLRCKHRWSPRVHTEKLPIICPKCKSPYWNRDKIRRLSKYKSVKTFTHSFRCFIGDHDNCTDKNCRCKHHEQNTITQERST